MPELKPHQQFERQVEKILRLLESTDATITWNDHIQDPDNPDQPRKIDVSIKRGGHLTIVECRAHKTPQDVQWIEQLLGRRISLSADAVIAVSSSGFTEGARAKAISKGIVLRNLEDLTEVEIKEWGERSTFTLIFYEFLNTQLIFELPHAVSSNPSLTTKEGRPILWRELLMQLADKYDRNKLKGQYLGFNAKINREILVDGVLPDSIQLQGRFRTTQTEFKLPVVKLYSNPIDEKSEARVEKFPVGTSQVIKGRELSSLVFDISQIEIPPDCIFGFPLFHQPGGMRIKQAEVVGAEKTLESKVTIACEFRFPAAA